jgi:hypothetical protein
MGPRRVAAWLLSFPLMVLGSQVAHVFAYRLAYPNAHVRLSELLMTGHSYMVGSPGYAPLLLGAVGAAELVGVGWVLAGGVRRRLQKPVPTWAFALLPMLCFTIQELLERWMAGSSFPWWMLLQPTFRIGLLIQLPIGLVAYLVARLLLRVADRVGRALSRPLARPALVGVSHCWSVVRFRPPRRRVLEGGHAGRAPPCASLALAVHGL